MQPFFLSAAFGQRFRVFHPAQGSSRHGRILYLHPFAEEMNKTRRMAACQAREMARQGYDVLQIDLLGCGDSSGDFGDATWDQWLDDARQASQWLRARSDAPFTLWGLRAGCLIAAEVAANLTDVAGFLFWQPVASGKQHWQQFIRLKVAGELASGQSKGVAEHIRQQLEAGHPIDVAGYTVAPALARRLQEAELKSPPGNGCRVGWLEVSSREDATLAPASTRIIEQWRQAGCHVDARVANGPAFWQTTEIETAPRLIEATMALLESWR